MTETYVIPCGTIVKTTIGGVVGMITGVCIRFDDAQYEISYFANDEEKTMWMRSQQFVADDFKPQPIGFRASPKLRVPEEPEDIPDIGVREYNILRSYLNLNKGRIRLSEISKRDLLRQRNCGPKAVEEIEAVLARHGIKLLP